MQQCTAASYITLESTVVPVDYTSIETKGYSRCLTWSKLWLKKKSKNKLNI